MVRKKQIPKKKIIDDEKINNCMNNSNLKNKILTKLIIPKKMLVIFIH